jgi:hypothetical protein
MWIVAIALNAGGCSAAPAPADSAPQLTSSVAEVHGVKVAPRAADRLARAGNARKDIDTGCPGEMASVDLTWADKGSESTRVGGMHYCIDRWEASLVELAQDGNEQPHSPYLPVGGADVRAVSRPGVFPQGYISEIEASRACARSSKRLCTPMEWRKACVGPDPKVWGYGTRAEPGRCNDHGKSPVLLLFGTNGYSGRYAWDKLNYPKLNQLEGTLAKTGDHAGCTNGYGVYDMVGNLHEWVADPRGTFYGGFYQDTRIHGEGCTYVTEAHAASYHDYSTGFRCCADAR